ncbi:MAG: IclR family transcriptional regulator [Pigmentiphaga sp.]
MAGKTKDGSAQRGIDAIGVAGEILTGLLRVGKPARLIDLERATGIASAKLHRYLVSLIQCGLVRRTDEGNRYDFGLLAFQIGQRAIYSSDLETMIGPTVQACADEIGESMGIAQWAGTGVVITRWYETQDDLQIMLRPGAAMSLVSSASGKIFGAHLPGSTVSAAIQEALETESEDPKVRFVALQAEYARIRDQGIAQALSSRVKGINALSVPVFARDGSIVVGVTVLGNAATFDADSNGPIANRLKELGRTLSSQLGSLRPE